MNSLSTYHIRYVDGATFGPRILPRSLGPFTLHTMCFSTLGTYASVLLLITKLNMPSSLAFSQKLVTLVFTTFVCSYIPNSSSISWTMCTISMIHVFIASTCKSNFCYEILSLSHLLIFLETSIRWKITWKIKYYIGIYHIKHTCQIHPSSNKTSTQTIS